MFKFLANDVLPETPLLADFEFANRILVVTGVNGVGKTRTLKGIADGSIGFATDADVVGAGSIVLLSSDQLKPAFEGGFNEATYQSMLAHTLAYFKRERNLFNIDYDVVNENLHMRSYRGTQGQGLNYSELHALCRSIAKDFDKSVEEITEEDIRINFRGSSQAFAGTNAFATTCNLYIKRIHNSWFNQWRNEKFGSDLAYVPLENIGDVFGEPPWDLMNKVLDESIGGKFRFQIPDMESFAYDYHAVLEEVRTGRPVIAADLSAGEQTLMWMVLIIFNMLYSKHSGQLFPKLILLDEPDVFLHPKMAKNLYSLLEAIVDAFETMVVITTHSPTTVALAPDEASIVIMNEGVLSLADKDYAIAKLLDGLNHISVSPENRRQVFVESTYDCSIYTAVYSKLKAVLDLDSGVSLSFVSSGPAYPKQALEDKARQYFNPNDLEMQDFLSAMRGDGDCSQVIGMVERLIGEGSKTVRGVIDWDKKKNNGNAHVAVFAKDYAYTMENVALDPIAVMLFIHNADSKSYPISEFCDKDVHYSEWLNTPELLQLSLDWFLKDAFGYDNAHNVDVEYASMSLKLASDKRYFIQSGHEIASILYKKYDKFRSISRNENALGSKLVEYFLHHTNGRFISVEFEKLFRLLQS
ncbi:AAA family ATPase [Pseudomonas graminis]|uniref:AAA family ATPase n=1 Tax=Pseudomonas graminis TaxID=158627 RepID=UPI003C2086A8